MRIRSHLLNIAYPLVQRYWRWRKPYFRTVRVIVRHGGDVLLIRHAYGAAAWGVPGGGIKRNEDPLVAAARETLEETGLSLVSIAGIPDNPLPALHDNGELWVFVAEPRSREHAIDNVEILDARWFADGELPTEILVQARHTLDAAGVKTS